MRSNSNLYISKLTMKMKDPKNVKLFSLLEAVIYFHDSDRKFNLATIDLGELHEASFKEKTVAFKIKEQTVCELDIELLCKYGQFGYGFSHQLANTDRSPFQNIEDGVFFRVHGDNVSIRYFLYRSNKMCVCHDGSSFGLASTTVNCQY